MPKAKQLPSGSWRCVVYIGTDANGKKKYKSITDADRIRCERLASEYMDEHREKVTKGTLGDCLETYLTLKKPVLSPSTYRGYKCTERYLKLHHRALCDLEMAKIDKQILQAVVNEMSARQSPKSVNNHISLILSVMKYNDYNPPELRLPSKERPDLHIPDTNTVKSIIKASEGTEMEIPILLAAFGPLRRSEICGLKLSDIDGNVIHVQRAVVMDDDYTMQVKTTKTYESNRFIPMDEAIIRKIHEKGEITKIKTPNGITKRFEQITERIGCKGVRFHDLRHWCASYLHAQGVPDQYIMARGGWKTDTVLKAVYRHSLESENQKWNQQINTMFNGIMGNDQ